MAIVEKRLVVRTAGDTFGGFVSLGRGCSSCGPIRGGVSLGLGTTNTNAVMSWEDFEDAYLALKAERETEEFKRHYAMHVAELGPVLLRRGKAP